MRADKFLDQFDNDDDELDYRQEYTENKRGYPEPRRYDVDDKHRQYDDKRYTLSEMLNEFQSKGSVRVYNERSGECIVKGSASRLRKLLNEDCGRILRNREVLNVKGNELSISLSDAEESRFLDDLDDLQMRKSKQKQKESYSRDDYDDRRRNRDRYDEDSEYRSSRRRDHKDYDYDEDDEEYEEYDEYRGNPFWAVVGCVVIIVIFCIAITH